MRPAKSFRQAASHTRNRQQVDMIAHQAISSNLDRVSRTVPVQELKVHGAVLIPEEYDRAPVPTLCDVMPATGRHDTRHSCHRS